MVPQEPRREETERATPRRSRPPHRGEQDAHRPLEENRRGGNRARRVSAPELARRPRAEPAPAERPPPPRESEPPPPPARPRIVDSVLRGRFSHAPPARSSWSLIARGPPKYSVPSRTIAITASVAAALSWPGAPARSRAEIGAASNVSSASRASVRNATSRGGRRFIPFPLGSRESHAQSSAWSASRARLRNAARTWRFDSRASPGTISSLCDTTRRRSGASDAATAARAEDD